MHVELCSCSWIDCRRFCLLTHYFIGAEKTAWGRFDRFAAPSGNDRFLRIPAEDLSRRRFGSGGAVKGVGAYSAEVRGSNPLRSTRKSPRAAPGSRPHKSPDYLAPQRTGSRSESEQAANGGRSKRARFRGHSADSASPRGRRKPAKTLTLLASPTG
jgi:hypothetical protein